MEDKLLNKEPAAAQTAENYHRVCDEIAEAAYKAGRDPSEIRLVGATKFKNCAEILPALKAGLAEVGENRAQEFRDKFDFSPRRAFGRILSVRCKRTRRNMLSAKRSLSNLLTGLRLPRK